MARRAVHGPGPEQDPRYDAPYHPGTIRAPAPAAAPSPATRTPAPAASPTACWSA
ncbi:hypothetical protein HFP43_16040 [Streptomyces sp. SJ1-7]|nr:hypothetical protein [Streptomyces sp. SJ1-7]